MSKTSEWGLYQVSCRTLPDVRSRDDLKQSVKLAIAANRWADVAALGAKCVQSTPDWVQGYVFQFDGFFRLGLYVAAARVLEEARAAIGDNEQVFVRQLALSNSLFRWDTTLELCRRLPSLAKAPGAVPMAFLAALHTKAFDVCRSILEPGALPPDRLKHLEADLDRDERDWTEIQPILEREISAKRPLAEVLNKQDFRLIPALAWRLYLDGRRDVEFFLFATTTISEEIDSSPRLMFLRQLANLHHPENPEFARRAARALIQKGRTLEAFNVLTPLVRFQRHDPEFLKLWLRARDAAGERPLASELAHTPISIDLSATSEDDFSKFEALRTANSAKWAGDAVTYGSTVAKLGLGAWSESIGSCFNRVPFPTLHQANRTPKVALCVSGQLRSFSSNWPSIKSNFVTSLSADLFFHTWDKQSMTPPRFARLNRFLPDEVVARLPAYLHNPPEFKKRFPRTFDQIIAPILISVDRQTLATMTEAKDIVIESEDSCSEIADVPDRLLFNGKANQVKMFYKTHACDLLRRQQEIKERSAYDVVIRMRPDLDIAVPHLEHYVQDCVTNRGRIYTSYLTADGCGDQFAIGSASAMQVYSSIWDYLKEHRRFDYLPGFIDTAAETLLGQHLQAHGIDVRLIPTVRNSLVSDLVVHHIDIQNTLSQDIHDGQNSQEVMPFFEAYAAWHKSQRISLSS